MDIYNRDKNTLIFACLVLALGAVNVVCAASDHLPVVFVVLISTHSFHSYGLR